MFHLFRVSEDDSLSSFPCSNSRTKRPAMGDYFSMTLDSIMYVFSGTKPSSLSIFMPSS